MQKIAPFLWFNDQAEEAANFYVSVFKDSKILNVSRYGEGGPRPKGTVMVVRFKVEGMEFMALNGGPQFTISPAISFVIHCKDQQEVDGFWEKLSAGGKTQQCGWLQDRYGVSWQVVPTVLGEMLSDQDAGRARRVMQAMLQMDKIEIAKLEEAYSGALT